VAWLSAAAARAMGAAMQARVAATAFEAAQTATVHPAAVSANRVSLVSLVATNFLGQNTPAIAANEFDYVEMWAQDVGAMMGYHAGAVSAAAALAPFSLPPVDLAGLASQLGAQVSGASAAVASTAESLVSGVPLESLSSFAQIALTPVGFLISPLLSLAQTANVGTAGLAGTAASVGGDIPALVSNAAPAVKGIGGVGGLGGGGVGAGLGQARLVGAMSVPPNWAGSMPKGMGSSVVTGLGGMTNASAAPAAQAGTGGMPMMPMPMGAGGAGGGMPAGMMGRGGANPQVVQARPSVIPRTGVG
jgi:PPE-repeat protein